MSELDMNEETGASLLEILEELTDRVRQAKSMPLSASVLINQSEVLDLLETARAIVPQQIVDADSVLQDASALTDNAHVRAEKMMADARARSEKTLADARSEADSVIAQAKAQAQKLVEKDAVTVAARAHAAKILDEARVKAQHIKQGADEYSDERLRDLCEDLGAISQHIDMLQDQIAAGREVLAERLSSIAYTDTANAGSKRRAAKAASAHE